MADQGRAVCVITLAMPDTDFFYLHATVERIVIGGRHRSPTRWHGLKANLGRILRLRAAIKRCGGDTVVGFVGTMNVLAVMACVGLKERVVVSERNDPKRQTLGMVWSTLRRLAYRFSDVVTANSQGAIDTLSQYVSSRKLAFLPNPVAALPPVSRCSSCQGGAILTVGRLHHQKAYDVLLEAFARLVGVREASRLSIVGTGELETALRCQAERLGIAERVTWHGQVDDPTVFYRETALFVLASRYEGVPNAMLEAMAWGLPLIISDASPGPLEYVEHNVTGLVVPVEDPIALAKAMEQLMNDENLRNRLGQAAAARVQRCGLTEVLPIWEQVLELCPLK